MPARKTTRIHATSVAWHGCAALLLGPSGSGKSGVALQMLALGCDLIADDQCELQLHEQILKVSCPDPIKGKIEARGFGILNSSALDQARLVCAVDLGTLESKRLPEARFQEFCGVPIRLFHNPGIEALPFALLQYLKGICTPD